VFINQSNKYQCIEQEVKIHEGVIRPILTHAAERRVDKKSGNS
jgi:hypothetical protein